MQIGYRWILRGHLEPALPEDGVSLQAVQCPGVIRIEREED